MLFRSTRRRIKLLDKAAVEKFSTFYFYRSGTNSADNFGLQITKANGSKVLIERKDAIKVDMNETPNFYRARFYGASFTYYKVAVADLEPGDIIDYYLIVNGSGYNFTGGAQPLPPVITTLNSDYSILTQKIDFVVDRGFFINFRSSNGAPELKKNPDIDRNTYSFSLSDKERNKIDDTRWLYEYRELPTVKFQVVFSQIGRDSRFFLGDIDKPTNSITADDVAKKINYWYTTNQYWSDYYVAEIRGRLRKDHGRTTDKNELAKLSYYYFRNIAFSKNTLYSYSAAELGYMPSDVFARVMYDLLRDNDVACDICVAPERSISKLEDVVLADEFNWFVKVGNDFIFPFTRNSNYKDIDPDLEGQDAYVVKIEKSERNQSASKTKIPVTTSENNNAIYNYNIKPDDDMENVSVVEDIKVKGISKRFYNGTVLRYYDWEKTDYLSYGGKATEEVLTDSRNKNKIAEAERQKKAKDDEDRKNKMDLMKDELKDEYDNIVSYDDFSITNDGRKPDAQDLVYTEKFKLGDMIKKVGPNYSVSLGALIGKQVELDKKETNRDYNIYLPFARTAEFNLVFEMPAGYKVEGLDALKASIDNATGTFTVTPTVAGNKITVAVKKVYKSNFVKKEDWPKMREFLDAAYNFTQKKVILSKGK